MPKGHPTDGLPRKRPRPCMICRHAERERIELLRASGVSIDKIAEKFGLSRDMVWRHWRDHVDEARRQTYLTGPALLGELSEIAAEESSSVLDHLRIMRSLLFRALSNSAKDGDYARMAQLSPPLLKVLKQLGHVTGEISQIVSNVTINNTHTTILTSAPFLDLQTGLLAVCAAHPDARAAIVTLLHDLDAKYAAGEPAGPPMRTITCEPVGEHADAG